MVILLFFDLSMQRINKYHAKKVASAKMSDATSWKMSGALSGASNISG